MTDVHVATVRLVCPQCRSALVGQPERLVCRNDECRATYPISDGLSRLVAEDATTLDLDEWRSVLASNEPEEQEPNS